MTDSAARKLSDMAEAGLSTLALSGLLFGLTLSNNGSDANNDIDIAAGIAIDSTNARLMRLATAITKQLDAAWAVGNNAGGLDTGSIANTTYHVWLIMRSDTGVVDVLFSTSATAPTMPTNYDFKRRIGSILRESGSLVPFLQFGDTFKRKTKKNDRSSTSAAGAALLALSVPLGVITQPIIEMSMATPASSNVGFDIGDAAAGGVTDTFCQSVCGAGETGFARVVLPGGFFTDTSARVYFAATIFAGSITGSDLYTVGWIDRRGRDA